MSLFLEKSDLQNWLFIVLRERDTFRKQKPWASWGTLRLGLKFSCFRRFSSVFFVCVHFSLVFFSFNFLHFLHVCSFFFTFTFSSIFLHFLRVSAGRARSLLREILSPTRMKLPELMGAIEKMEDLVRRYCSRRDAQGNAHNLAEDIPMSSLEALLPDDLEKHVQLNRARLTSYGVLREEIKTYCGSRSTKRETERSITPRRR